MARPGSRHPSLAVTLTELGWAAKANLHLRSSRELPIDDLKDAPRLCVARMGRRRSYECSS